MEGEQHLLVPLWVLENIENTLCMAYNIREKKQETCFDRNVRGSLNCVRKILNGAELTGMERLEPLYFGENGGRDKPKPASPDVIAFDKFWESYDKAVARRKAEALWARLSKRDRAAALAYIPAYKAAQPDKRYRKNPDTFLRNRSWEDEIIDQTTHTTHATLPHSATFMAETNKAEVRELSRIATAGAAALAGLVGGCEDE